MAGGEKLYTDDEGWAGQRRVVKENSRRNVIEGAVRQFREEARDSRRRTGTFMARSLHVRDEFIENLMEDV